MEILGVDIGGSGVKGAPVDVEKGVLVADRYRLPTPDPSTPDAVGDTVVGIAKHFRWEGPIGCTFPAVIKEGVVYTAANVDRSWIGVDGAELLEKKTGCLVLMINDADAAGMAEMQVGAGQGHKGVVFMLTFGTGLGSAVFVNGALLPNTELGHVLMVCGSRGVLEAEEYASDRIRQEERLGWAEWAGRVSEYLGLLEALFSPDLFILGGGVSRQYPQFSPSLHVKTEVLPARLRNNAGIVGAALAAQALVTKRS
jgi:polyphosphate glucokinase